jgi:4-aminobutyrate aminotransferase/(S)-3-amino-2-methylpropionate transaminase
MGISGDMLVGGQWRHGKDGGFRVVDPRSGAAIEPEFGLGGPGDVDDAATLAEAAFDEYRATDPATRAALLERIAERIEHLGAELVERAAAETGLTVARLESERVRTTAQLRLFATTVRDGQQAGVRIDHGDAGRTPVPRPDLRLRRIPVGPVAVFGSSNFPLAFSNAGGDTASALAAGCPVIVKVHSAHPGTAMLVSGAIAAAVEDLRLPAGVHSALIGGGPSLGAELVAHPAIKAVGFTGSRSGGLALMRIAAARPEPIPVYAEMSSVNPVVILAGALRPGLAEEFFASVTLGAGQFCTNPGLVFVPQGPAGDAFASRVAELVRESVGQTMLTLDIAAAYTSALAELAHLPGTRLLATGSSGTGPASPAPAVLETTAERFASEPSLQAEVFGAAALVVRYAGVEDLEGALRQLDGQLTASIHLGEREGDVMRRLVRILELKSGRLIVNGWPTGVEVAHAIVHGGPFPATSDPRSTSVGTLAIERFLRPVSYQGFPDSALPVELQQDNPWMLSRLVDGRLEEPGADGDHHRLDSTQDRPLGGPTLPQERRLVTEIPGPRSRHLLERKRGAVADAVNVTLPVFAVAAGGGVVVDIDGNSLIDLGSGIAVTTVGNAAPQIVEAITAQARQFSHTCFMITGYEGYVEVAETLNRLTPGEHEKRTALFNSGAEAVENAVKIARAATGRQAVVAFDHAYHGRTNLTMALTAKSMPYKSGFGPFASEIYRAPMSYPFRDGRSGPDAARVALSVIEKQIGRDNLAAVIIEPIQGEGGFIVPAEGFLTALSEWCTANGVVFIADEVQTGFARTGAMFAVDHERVVPDLVVMAKGIAGGMPLAAVTGRAELMDAVHTGGLGGTYGGNPVACAAALASLDLFEHGGLVERAQALEPLLRRRLDALRAADPRVGDVRGRGAMMAIELVDPATGEPDSALTQRIAKIAHAEGVIVLTCGTFGNVIRLLPPLSISDELLSEGLDVIERALARS